MIYLISDTHFEDKDVIKICGRPDNQDLLLADRWNDTVKDGDEVYLLGDVGNLDHIDILNGTKYLIMGNHDNNLKRSRLDTLFRRVYDKPIVLNEYFILSHEPISYIQPNGVFANIFGHVHNSPHITTYSSRHYCVSAERINYTPISLDKIIETMRDCG